MAVGNCGLDLQPDVIAIASVSGEHFDHFEVWERSEEVERPIFGELADDLCLAQETESLVVAILWLDRLPIGFWQLQCRRGRASEKSLCDPLAWHQVRL